MQTVRVRIITQVRGRKESVSGSTKLGSQSEACRYSLSHPLLRRKGGGFCICMLVCNSWHYITCRQQSNSCGIVKVLFHMGEQSVELHSWGKGFWWQHRDSCSKMHGRDHPISLVKNYSATQPQDQTYRRCSLEQK